MAPSAMLMKIVIAVLAARLRADRSMPCFLFSQGLRDLFVGRNGTKRRRCLQGWKSSSAACADIVDVACAGQTANRAALGGPQLIEARSVRRKRTKSEAR